MKKLLAILLIVGTALAATASYNVIMAENGNAFVSISLSGQGAINLPMPVDAEPQVSNALYIQTTNGIDVSLGTAESAFVTYQSSILTDKQDGEWTFELEVSDADTNTVTLSLPTNVAITSTTPQASMADAADSKNVLWSNAVTSVSAIYTLTEGDVTPQQPPTDGETPTPSADYTLFIVLIVVIIIVAAAVFFLKKKK